MTDDATELTKGNTGKTVGILSKFGEGSGAVGSVIAAMGCAMCFPAMASLGAALGLGFLDQWEGLFRTTLMPVFAWLALITSALGWFAHHSALRSLAGMVGPALVLLALYPLFGSPDRNAILYTGLALMVGFALWDIFIRPRGKKA